MLICAVQFVNRGHFWPVEVHSCTSSSWLMFGCWVWVWHCTKGWYTSIYTGHTDWLRSGPFLLAWKPLPCTRKGNRRIKGSKKSSFNIFKSSKLSKLRKLQGGPWFYQDLHIMCSFHLIIGQNHQDVIGTKMQMTYCNSNCCLFAF